MHSQVVGKTRFHYNSDMSGDVHVIVGDAEVQVPGKDLIAFVGFRIIDALIGRLEQVAPMDVWKLITGRK